MSFRGATLSDLELRYPFAPTSRKFFESIPVEDGLASREVIDQARSRLMSSLGRVMYEPHMSELIEFSSFFAAALVASQESFLVSRFAKKEAERSKEFFLKERPDSKIVVMSKCFGAKVEALPSDGGLAQYKVSFEDYLSLVSKHELGKSPTWKLVRQALGGGTVYLSDNMLNDLFGDCAQVAIAEGVGGLRRAAFPKQLLDVRSGLMDYVPVQRPRSGRSYGYVEDLMKHPVSDGRHRFVWLVLAPYLVNVRKLENQEAIEKIRAFVAVGGETSDLRRFVEYNVRRARRNGLLPPTLSTLKTEHPDLYGLLPKEVLAGEGVQKKPVK